MKTKNLIYKLISVLFFLSSLLLHGQEQGFSHSPAIIYKKNKINNPILQCLAQEELSIAKTTHIHPVLRINREIIDQLIEIDHIRFLPEIEKHVCNPQGKSPTIILLKYLTLTPQIKKLFLPSIENQYSIKSKTKNFLETMPRIFMTFLFSLQEHLKSAEGLQTEIPELAPLLLRFQHLEEESGYSFLKKEENSLKIIFDHLTTISLEEFLGKINQKEKEEIKKTIRPNKKDQTDSASASNSSGKAVRIS